MTNVIGLGNTGCNIAENLEEAGYNVKLIDEGIEGEANCFALPKAGRPEEYEATCPDVTDFLSGLQGKTYFILSGAGNVSGAALKILEKIKHLPIEIVYVLPDLSELTYQNLLQTKVTFGVLQEYTRSGMFRKMYIYSNTAIDNCLDAIPFGLYWKTVNKTISDSIIAIDYYDNSDPLYGKLDSVPEHARIASVGLYDIEDDSQENYFDLEGIRQKVYNFSYNEQMLNSDTRLLKTIKEKLKKKEERPSYRIYSTKSEDAYCYTVGYTNQIQSLTRENK
jgi:hypothetical protein